MRRQPRRLVELALVGWAVFILVFLGYRLSSSSSSSSQGQQAASESRNSFLLTLSKRSKRSTTPLTLPPTWRSNDDTSKASSSSLPLASSQSSAAPVAAAPALPAGHRIGVLLLCYNRIPYLDRTMASLLQIVPDNDFPIIISQDGNVKGMRQHIQETFVDNNVAIHIQHHPRKEFKANMKNYYYIAEHYRFALTKVFDVMKFDTIIIVEDDMEFSPDFFDYFAALAPVLHADPSLLCVSAWNDNGFDGMPSKSNLVKRTSVFPGLGWMLTRNLWNELKPKWPNAFWDDWLREPDQRKGRDCIHPMVSRTRTFGEQGASGGQFYRDYLTRIALNQEAVDWSKQSFAHLDQRKFGETIYAEAAAATTLATPEDMMKAVENTPKHDVKIYFRTGKQFTNLAKMLGIMPDLKAGMPRGSFEGILAIPLSRDLSVRLFILPVSLIGRHGIKEAVPPQLGGEEDDEEDA